MWVRTSFTFFVFLGLGLIHWAHGLCVNVARVPLRSGPGTKFKENWVVGKYTPLKRQGPSRNGWIPVTDMDGQKHWVYSGAVTDRYSCASVKVDYTVLRSSPSETAPLAKLKFADKYWPARKIGSEDDWWHLEDDFGNRYWVHEKKLWRPLVYTQINYQNLTNE